MGATSLAIYFRDISSEKRQQQLVEENEERLRAVANASVDAVYDWHAETNHLWWNEGISHVFGHDPADVSTIAAWEDLIHPDDRNAIIDRYRSARASRAETVELEYRLIAAQGKYIEVVDRSRFFYATDGTLTRVVGGLRNISERKRAEARLREQAELVNKAQDAIVVRDLDHKVLLWNPSAERMYGWSADEVIGRKVTELGINKSSVFVEAHETVCREGSWSGELVQTSRDGRTLEVEARWTLVEGTDGQSGRVLAINTDRTEQKRLEEHLHQASKLEALGQLTGGVAHDFNNLLMIISGNSELLEERLDSKSLDHELSSMISRAAARGADLTSRLLSFGRRQTLQPVAVSVQSLFRGAGPLWQRTLPANVLLDVEAVSDTHVCADQSQWELALLNLVLNARDAMPLGGTITVDARQSDVSQTEAAELDIGPGQYIALTVSDNGSGIATEHLGRIFEPFFSTKPAGRGTGLGLSMVYGFARQSGGTVTVRSVLSEGTRISLLLPQAVGVQNSIAKPQASQRTLVGMRILAVDDNPELLASLLRLLASLGLVGTGAENADQALVILDRRDERFDFLLSDVVMPGSISGVSLASQVSKRWPHIGIVLASGNIEHGGPVENMSDHQFLQKPFRRSQLREALLKASQKTADRKEHNV
ncbi:hybrid sensor histidine kinase/response regulator [Pelagibacterium luteolum]|uniref:histidine kinase n=1 Tax=Pelagibacterium luteolum TaxID=440168 RepID=A0A1G8AIR3_9HYPH|nr:PAS domain-containing sensor histidine kinase [Pelagibacterium luteolum]SDH20811.1 PAS domain S-box-containing protein [Pelagibacterium luteolum]